MIGRYGPDQLSMAILILSLILEFVPYYPARIVSLLLLALMMFRMLSKNIYKRQNENAKFLSVWNPVKNFFVRLFKGHPDKATHIHFRCPKCHQEMRVPRGVGKIVATCPKCGHKITKKT